MEITHKQRPRLHAVAAQFLPGIAGVALITFVCFKIGFGVGRTSLAFLIWIALVSLLGSFVVSVVLSIVAVACLNYFFVPPLFEFRIDAAEDAERLAMFLTTSLIVTALTTKLKRAQEELGETNLRLEKAHRIAHVGWWQHDLITDGVAVSDEVGRILGMRPVAPWLELIHAEDRARVADAAAAAVRPGGPRYDVEYRVLRPDGALRVVHSQGDVTWDGSGRPLRKFGVLQDITELKQVERELRASEARFRSVVDHASDAFFLYNEDATVLDVNRQACESLGYRRDELIGMTAFDYGPDLTPALLQRIRERLRAGKVVSYDGRHRRRDGTVFPVEVRMRALRREGQLLAVSLDRDITERKRAEDELRASEERFRIFVDHATDAFLLLDDDWTILDVNRQACHGLGYSREELIGKHKSDFDVSLDGTSIQRLKQRIVAGEAITFETRHRRKDGTSFPVEVRLNQFEQGGRRYLCLVRDITERKRAEDELRASEERFRTLFQFSFEVYWETDTQHRFTRLEYAQGLVEAPASRTEIGKKPWELRNFEADAEAWRKHREALDAHLPFRDFEVARRTPDGSKRHMSVSGLPVFDEWGGFVGYRGAGRDITERKTAEEALRRSEAYLAGAQELSHSAAFAHNLKENLYWSEGLYRIWGFDPSRGMPTREACFQRIHPDDRDRVRRVAEEAARQKQDYTIEYRIVLPDGTLKHLRAICHPSYSPAGELVEVVGTALDETERKRAEDELRASEERFRTLIQFSFDVYWESDAQHRFIRQEFAEGLTDAPAPGSEIGKTRWEVPYLEPDEEGWRKHRETLDAHLPFRDFELARPAPDGGKRYVSVSGLPMIDKAGRFIGYRGVGRHITERKRVEEALRHSEAYLAEAQRLSHTGTLAFNATAAVYWSEESYRIWGFDPLQGLPDRKTVMQRIHPDDRERVNAEIDKVLHARGDFAFEFRIVLPDGTVKYIETTGRPMFSAQGELVAVVATHIDVTERKRAQEEHKRLRQLESDLAHMNRVSIMGELAASLAHEILHPIATSRNNARAGMRFLEVSPPNLPEVKEALACIVRDADRAKGIVDRMRDHIKKAPPRSEPFDLNEAIDEVIEMVQSAITKNGVLVRTTLKGSLLVHGDRVQLQQVVLNLILNAVEAMSSVEEDARELSISTKQGQTSEVLVAVQDSGPGIDPERLDKVFAAFYTTKNTGIGMGLSICRSIITAHGGRLWAEANRPRGAVFQFTLPAGPQGS